jgi:acid phosphatase family membrane protein YuiD
MDYSYLLCPFVAWLTAGILKFCINSLFAKKLAFGLIGYGGLPSNHSAIVSSMATLIALKEGIHHPAFGVALALAFIVLLDASSLRKQVSNQAVLINQLAKAINLQGGLRERIGHTLIEIVAGVAVGALVALVIFTLTSRP